MELDNLTALSPLDGRYFAKTSSLRDWFSEYGLIKARLEIEVRWLLFLSDEPTIKEVPPLSKTDKTFLEQFYQNFTLNDANRIKTIEKTTNHDLKAVEYFIKENLEKQQKFQPYISFIHFGCTSEDINNLSYGILLNQGRSKILVPSVANIYNKLITLAKDTSGSAMLSRTHGQSATPTTMGKELINFAHRIKNIKHKFNNIKLQGKFNGAVGNYNAHHIAYPEINWPKLAQNFVTELGLDFNPYTTQINPHDDIAEFCHELLRLNNVLLDLVRDIWSYISLGYFKQKLNPNEIGSSTMPHKVNPIDFENAEGNLGLANSLLNFFCNKLPISRLQRDLSDSTVLRNLGPAFGYCLIAYQSILTGLDKLTVNNALLRLELNNHWEVLAEPVQTVMRRYGILDAYEQLKDLTRGEPLNQALLHEFINNQPLAKDTKDSLKKLTPADYIGYACVLVDGYTS